MIHTTTQLLGSVPVEIEYEHQAAESASAHHPGTPADVAIITVRIAGKSVTDPESSFSEWQMEAWSDAILAGHSSERDRREAEADAYWDDRLDDDRLAA